MFHARRLAQSPFWLGSLAVATAGWVVALIGCVLSTTDIFLYWTLAFLALVLMTSVYIVGAGSILRYRLSLLAFHAISFVYASLAVNAKIYLEPAEDLVAGFGFAFMAGALLAWLVVMGVEDSGAVMSVASSGSRRKVAQFNGTGMPRSQTSRSHSPSLMQQHQRTASNGNNMANAPSSTMQAAPRPHSASADSNTSSPSVGGHGMDIGRDAEYMYKGQALYAYTSSPDDPNELSFSKGELLDIVDNKGKWWQAKKADGSIGIVPSNYVKLL